MNRVFLPPLATFKRLLIWLGGLLLALLCIAWVTFSFFHEDIRLKAEQVVDKQLNAIVQFDDLSITVFQDFPNPTITLHNLIITGKEEFQNDTLARIDEFDVEVKLTSLFLGQETELKSIHLRQPQLFLTVLKDGRTNFDIQLSDSVRAIRKSTDPGYVNLALDQINISRGEITHRDLVRGLYVKMSGVAYSGTGDFQKDIFDLRSVMMIDDFTLDYGQLHFVRKEIEVDMKMEINLDKKSLVLKENNIRINHFKFNMEGAIAVLKNGYDFNITFATQETSFRNIVSLVPGIYMHDFKQISTSGELGFNGFVSGQYLPAEGRVPSMMVNFKVSDAQFKIDTLPDPIDNIQLELEIKNLSGRRDSTVFDVKKFQFEMRQHKVQGRFKVKGMDHLYIDTDILADLDLAELERMYPIRGIDLKGLADFEIQARGPLAFHQGRLTHVPVFHLNMKLKNGRVKYDSLPAAIDSIQFHLVADNITGELEKSVFDFRGLHLNLDKNRIHGFLHFQGYNAVQLKTEIKADVDLADLETIFPIPGWRMKGQLGLDIKANGVYDHANRKFPVVDASLALKHGFLQTDGYPEPLENITFSGEVMNATGRFPDTRIAINHLSYTLEQEPFDIKGSITNLDTYEYDLKIKGLVDLGKMSKVYPMGGVQVSGQIYTDLETKGRLSDIEAGNYQRTTLDGRMEITDLLLKLEVLPSSLLIEKARFSFTPKKVILDSLSATYGKSTMLMSGDLYNYMAFATRTDDLIMCDIAFSCDTLDVHEWLVSTKPVAPPVKNSKSKLHVWQVPENVHAIFDSKIEHVQYEDMRMSHLDGEIEMKEGVMSFRETGFNALDADFSVSGKYDTRDIQHPVFDIDLDIKELDINRAYRELRIVRELLPAAGDANGMLSIDYKLKGELTNELYPKMESMAGKGVVRISNAKINGMKIFEELSKAAKKQEVNDPHLKDFVIHSEIRDSKIFVKPFSIKVSGFETDVEGVSEISGAIRYLVKLQLLPFGVKVPFHVTGTYENPKVTIGKGHVLTAQDSLSN